MFKEGLEANTSDVDAKILVKFKFGNLVMIRQI